MVKNTQSGNCAVAHVPGQPHILRTFVIKTDARPTNQVFPEGSVEENYYSKAVRNHFSNRIIEAERQKLVIVVMSDDEFTFPYEAVSWAEARGWQRPVYEDALFFLEQHSWYLNDGSVLLFPHEPWRDEQAAESYPGSISMMCLRKKPAISLPWFWGNVGPGMRYAFRVN